MVRSSFQTEDSAFPEKGFGKNETISAEFPGFEFLSCLGKRGRGTLWKAREVELDRFVAIKLLHTPEDHPEVGDPFLHEAKAMARLAHPNIVTLYSFGRTLSGHCYMVMEWVEGPNLNWVVENSKPKVPEALRIVGQICDALQHAHDQGVVHSDLKPENVLLDHAGRVKLANFGLASIDKVNELSSQRETDISGVGVMFYEMLTGEAPSELVDIRSRKKYSRSGRLEWIFQRMLIGDPAQRYQSMTDLKGDVEWCQHALDPQRKAEEVAKRKDQARQRLQTFVAALAALAIGGWLAWSVRPWLGPQRLATHSVEQLASPQGSSPKPTSEASGKKPRQESRFQPAETSMRLAGDVKSR